MEVKKGDKYGRLTIIRELPPRRYSTVNSRLFLCECSCGNIKKILLGSLRGGKTTSCGCVAKMYAKIRATTHGGTKTAAYVSWRAMKERCLNKENKVYKHYGERGIKICKRWMKFENFYKDMGERQKGRTLDRIDNDGNYCKENCRWATREEQCNNRRVSHFLNYKGKKQTIAQWTKELGFGRTLIKNRLARGWSIKKALTIKK